MLQAQRHVPSVFYPVAVTAVATNVKANFTSLTEVSLPPNSRCFVSKHSFLISSKVVSMLTSKDNIHDRGLAKLTSMDIIPSARLHKPAAWHAWCLRPAIPFVKVCHPRNLRHATLLLGICGVHSVTSNRAQILADDAIFLNLTFCGALWLVRLRDLTLMVLSSPHAPDAYHDDGQEDSATGRAYSSCFLARSRDTVSFPLKSIVFVPSSVKTYITSSRWA